MKTTTSLTAATFAILFATACAQDDPFSDDGAASSESGSGSGSTSPTTSGATTTASTTASSASSSASTTMADTGDTEDSAETGPGTTGTGDCPTTPTRLVVLGDSIFACFGAVVGKDSDTCSAKIFHDYVAESVGPISYENLAVNGAVTRDVAESQLGQIDVGVPGHVMVLIFIGGNDLSGYIFESDEATMADYAEKRVELDGYWATIFAYLEDPANFPDGTTIVMNTQYNPFDDCTAQPYPTMTPAKTALLAEYNADLVMKAEAHNGWIADQHAAFLGHGHHYAESSCPFYMDGADGWMFDLIHPNVPGHATLATQLSTVADEIYAGCE